jgi:NADPH-dependent 2,4-dienoyl-CoA reductase/sulfur reductase-like enzyme/nitrite reductase/ring-hydroxylating ferredoxin subunit
MADADQPSGPDLRAGVKVADLPDGGTLSGIVDGEPAILVRQGDALFAVGAHCTHYHGPLADGLVADESVRCPWHHACFSLRTGEALRAPALDPIACWRVERRGDTAFVREKLAPPAPPPLTATRGWPGSVVIVGGGAAGLAAADTLRREGYDGPVAMISADDSPPCDRPNLSKDYLAGSAPDDWIPLRPSSFYAERGIELVLGARVASLDLQRKKVRLESGATRSFGALLLATGADPVRLRIPGKAALPIHYLRSFDDSRAIVASARGAGRALVVGASFIGLEVAASLRARGIEVDVVAPESVPLERVLGPDVGRFVRDVHESHGVRFHLGRTLARIEGREATLSDGTTLRADLAVLGVGVRPSVELAEQAGLSTDRGILVDEHLETSAPGVFSAGDVARWPDPRSGERVRVEHWVVAERQGQVAARNMLGRRERFRAVPFFWSQHYDVALNYVGHAESWDKSAVDGSLESRDATVTYSRGGRTLAVVTVSRDRESLRAELAMEREGERER